MTSKHFVNDPKTLVKESLQGLAYANPRVQFDPEYRVLYRKKVDENQVHVVSGGGSGHEPAHAAFVGDGILSAAAAGNTFASPNSKQVSAAIQRVSKGKGVLIVTKSYTGDILQFGLARERYVAASKAPDSVKMITVGDDIAVGREAGALVGRRGMAGTVLVYKAAGALAAKGANLNQVHAVGQYVADNSATLGCGLEHTHVPGSKSEPSHLEPTQCEIGMGIHNEPGNKTVQLNSARELASEMLSMMTDMNDKDRAFVDFNTGKDVLLLVNNLGGISELELGLMVKEAGSWLAEHKYNVRRVISGTFVSSLNMPGISYTLVKLPSQPQNLEGFNLTADSLLELFDAKTDAPGWKWTPAAEPSVSALNESEKSVPPPVESTEPGPPPADPKLFIACVKAACEKVSAGEPTLTEYDTVLGDGDCGETFQNGAEGVLKKIKAGEFSDSDVSAALVTVSEVVEKEMGGTSGGLFSIFFNSWASACNSAGGANKTPMSSEAYAKTLETALNQLFRYTRARPPSRTLMDPLAAFIGTFSQDPSDFTKAYKAAQDATAATSVQEAKAGRAAYVEKSKVSDANIPDAGAAGICFLLEGIKDTLKL